MIHVIAAIILATEAIHAAAKVLATETIHSVHAAAAVDQVLIEAADEAADGTGVGADKALSRERGAGS